jgi:PAS domain S-box-containing protein
MLLSQSERRRIHIKNVPEIGQSSNSRHKIRISGIANGEISDLIGRNANRKSGKEALFTPSLEKMIKYSVRIIFGSTSEEFRNMSNNEPIVFLPIQLLRFALGIALLWTVAVALTLTWEIWDEFTQAKEIAEGMGQSILADELAFHRWSAEEGGVYVPVSAKVQPDPILAKIAERDVETPSGRKLTLIKPALMMSELDKTALNGASFKSHLANIEPLRPENAPDPWEKEALSAFAAGSKEKSGLDQIDGESYLRVMRPIFFKESPLENLTVRKHKPGELVGGISVSVPMKLMWPMEWDEIIRRLVGYGGMWALGMVGIVFTSRQLQGQIRRRQTAEDRLLAAQLVLEQRVAERTQQLAQANTDLKKEIAERVQTEKWLIESETRFRGYFELGVEGMVILTPDKQWAEINPQFCKMLHYSPLDLEKKSWFDLTHPDDRVAEEKCFDRLLEGIQGGYSLEKRFLAANGQTVWAKVSMKCLRQANGEIDSIIALVHQIDRKA